MNRNDELIFGIAIVLAQILFAAFWVVVLLWVAGVIWALLPYILLGVGVYFGLRWLRIQRALRARAELLDELDRAFTDFANRRK